MTTAVTVREATLEDVEAIIEVAEAAWYASYGSFMAPETIATALETNYDPELVSAGIDHDAIAFYVAEAGSDSEEGRGEAGEERDGADEERDGADEERGDAGEVVGFGSAERTWADEVELHTVYVHPDRWGEGIGSALVDRVDEWAQSSGVDRIACGVLAENAVGVDFLEAIGFERGRKTDVEIAGEGYVEYEFLRTR